MSLLTSSRRQFDFVRTSIRNSPWISIAVLCHILLFAILSVAYIAGGKENDAPSQGVVAIAPRKFEAPPLIEPEVQPLIRTDIPVIPDEQPGPVNEIDFIRGADPGPLGEITHDPDPTKSEPGDWNPDPEAPPDVLSGARGGTPIGVGSDGHRSRGTDAFSGRIPGDGGKGGGGPGGGKGGHGGDPITGPTVTSALIWLKRHQSPDGSWDCDGFSAQCKKNTCSGAGQAPHDVGVTGLALLCFLGAGQTQTDGDCKMVVSSALKYLVRVQQPDGCFGDRASQHFMYDHACAALAMAEAYGMTLSPSLKGPAQKGINFILQSQNPYSAWRYASPPDGSNDTSVTGWMVMVLKSGKMANLVVDEQALVNAMTWIDEMTDPQTGRTGYTDVGGMPSRLNDMMAKFPAERSESMTAVGLLTRIFSGHTLESDPLIAKGADLLASKLPRWDPATGEVDFYYWYYATLAMFQIGGPRWDHWNQAIKEAVVEHQRKNVDEDELGSWDPLDPWSSVGGRVYSTAVNCLSMEVYYRYPRVFGTVRKQH